MGQRIVKLFVQLPPKRTIAIKEGLIPESTWRYYIQSYVIVKLLFHDWSICVNYLFIKNLVIQCDQLLIRLNNWSQMCFIIYWNLTIRRRTRTLLFGIMCSFLNYCYVILILQIITYFYMEYISLSWYDIPELVVLIMISLIEGCY
jgi:hypothetical protein